MIPINRVNTDNSQGVYDYLNQRNVCLRMSLIKIDVDQLLGSEEGKLPEEVILLILKNVYEYIERTDIITEIMKENTYELVNKIFFDERWRTPLVVKVVNEIKGILNAKDTSRQAFYAKEYFKFFDVMYSEHVVYYDSEADKDVEYFECEYNEFLKVLITASDDEYYQEHGYFYEFTSGPKNNEIMYLINFLMNDNKELLKNSNVKNRINEIMDFNRKFFSSTMDKNSREVKKQIRYNKNIFKKVSKKVENI